MAQQHNSDVCTRWPLSQGPPEMEVICSSPATVVRLATPHHIAIDSLAPTLRRITFVLHPRREPSE
eukprot:12015826-Alexandrium_andersonii.AAC.1